MFAAIILVLCCIFGPTEVQSSPPSYQKLDLLFVMATHQDIAPIDLIVQKQYLGNLVSTLDIGDCSQRVALMNYGSTPEILWDFSSDISKDSGKILQGINGVTPKGGKQGSLVPAITMATHGVFGTRGNRVSAPDMTIFIISATSDSTDGLQEAVDALKQHSYVLVIPVTTRVNMAEVNMVADVTASVNQFSFITSKITNTSSAGECQECLPGYIDLDVKYSDSLKGYIVKRKMKPSKKPFEAALDANKPLDVTMKNKIIIERENGFFVYKVCMFTQYVGQIKLKGLDKDGEIVGKEMMKVVGDGMAMTESCLFHKETLDEVNMSKYLRINFSPISGYLGKMKVQNLDVLACGE